MIELTGNEYTLFVTRAEFMTIATGYVKFIPVKTMSKFAQGDILYIAAKDENAGNARKKGHKIEDCPAVAVCVTNVMRGGKAWLPSGFQILSFIELPAQDEEDQITTNDMNPVMKRVK